MPYLGEFKKELAEPLRNALDAAFSALPPGVYHRSGNFVEHAIFAHNPLLLGRGAGAEGIAIYLEGVRDGRPAAGRVRGGGRGRSRPPEVLPWPLRH